MFVPCFCFCLSLAILSLPVRGSNGPRTDTQYQALVQLYDSTDGANWRPNNWLHSDAYCDWTGVDCDAHDNVVALSLPNMGLNGQLSDLSALPYLTMITLDNNTLKDSDLCALERLPYLRHVSLIDTRLDGNIPECLCSMDRLQNLHLDNNTLIGDIPACLGSRLQLFTARCNYLQFGWDHTDVAGIDYVNVNCNPPLECGDADYVSSSVGHYACGSEHCNTCRKKTTCAAFLDVGGCRYYLVHPFAKGKTRGVSNPNSKFIPRCTSSCCRK